MNSTLQLRIDDITKTKAQKIVRGFGTDLSSVVKMFITQIVRTNSIPLQLTSNGLTPAQEKRFVSEAKKETAWALKHRKGYTDPKKLIDDMLA